MEEDSEVEFVTSGGNEQIEVLLERVRESLEKAFNELPNFLVIPDAKQHVAKPVVTVDFTTKSVKELLKCAATGDTGVQHKAISELISRWKPAATLQPAAAGGDSLQGMPEVASVKGEANADLIGTLKVERGLKTLLAVASEAKDLVKSEVVACQAQLSKLLSLLTESSSIRVQIRQLGAIPTIAQMLAAWCTNVDLKKDLILNGLAMISNLCFEEVPANAFRKAKGIPTVVSMATQNDQDLKSAALHVLIILAKISVKNQEAMVTSELLECLFTELKNVPPQNIENKYLQLLLILSSCAKTRAMAASELVLSLLPSLRITDAYPKVEQYQIRIYFRNTDVQFDGMPNSETTILQGAIFDILTNFMQNESHRHALAAEGSWLPVILSYLTPVYDIPFDMYKWNFDLVAHAMKFTLAILVDDAIRGKFVENNAYAITGKYLTFFEIFPSNILLAAGELISILANRKTEGTHLAKFGTEGLGPLLRLFNMFPTNDRLQLLVARTINSLSLDSKNNMAVFQEGGLQILNTLAKDANDDVAAIACDAFCTLSADKFVRRAIRVVGTIVPTLVSLLQKPKINIQKPCIIVLRNLTLEVEGLDVIADVKTGATPAILTPLMQSSDSLIQNSTLKIIDLCVKNKEFLSKFVEMQGLPRSLVVMMDQNEEVQARVLILLATLAMNGDCREKLIRLGLVDKLKLFAKHPNVTKPNAELVPFMKTLILNLKAPPAANSYSETKTIYIQCSYNGEKKPMHMPSSIYLDSFHKMLRDQFNFGDDMVISVQYVGKTGNKRITTDASLESLMQRLNAAETHQFLVFAVKFKEGMANMVEAPSYDNVVKQLQDALVNKTLQLRHVDMEAEQEKRRKEKLERGAGLMMRDIERMGKLRQTSTDSGEKRLFVDQCVLPPGQLYKTDIKRWIGELQSHFDLRSKLVLLVFRLIDMRRDEVAFTEARDMIKHTGGPRRSPDMSADRLCEFLRHSGFAVKKNRFQEHTQEEVTEEYMCAIRPATLPTHLLLRTILLTLEGRRH